MCFIFVVVCLSELLGKFVVKIDSCIGFDVEVKVGVMVNGDVVLLENVCFFVEEEKNEVGFVEKFVGLVEVYVNDVFGVVYCVYVFIEGVIKFFKFFVVGFLMEKEF